MERIRGHHLTLLSKLNFHHPDVFSVVRWQRRQGTPCGGRWQGGVFLPNLSKHSVGGAPLGLNSVALALQSEPGEFNLYLDMSVRKIGYPAPSPPSCRS